MIFCGNGFVTVRYILILAICYKLSKKELMGILRNRRLLIDNVSYKTTRI